jgi:hypothetical protein
MLLNISSHLIDYKVIGYIRPILSHYKVAFTFNFKNYYAIEGEFYRQLFRPIVYKGYVFGTSKNTMLKITKPEFVKARFEAKAQIENKEKKYIQTMLEF